MPHTLAHNQVDCGLCLDMSKNTFARIARSQGENESLRSLSDVCQLVAQIECATPMALRPLYVPFPDLTR